MRRFLGVFLLVACLVWLPSGGFAAAQEVPTGATAQKSAKKPQKEKGNGVTLFLLVFGGAVLFVLSTATALNSLGGKPPAKRDDARAPARRSANGDPKSRFRL